ncbi:TIM-barrel domain-containing protein [Psychromonas ossibalaenae]|uniref:TIM-barrel domain-containing protein n=1 Tax=Psychromonas ossibalaenae TaxID=444922 RepID=UPI000369497D|nr:TIM-barrel domain-containing protein [Psychromonas ossibalaenae]
MRIFVLFLTLLFSAQSWADIQWLAKEQTYKLNGATLFKLRKQLNKEEQNSLKTLRNVVFNNRAEFEGALETAIGKQHAMTETLTGKAEMPAVSYGIEARNPLLSLVISDGDYQQDENAFTQQSWLQLPELNKTPQLKTTFSNQCLQVASQNVQLFELCSGSQNGESKSAYLKTDADSILGLGQEFVNPGVTTANRLGDTRNGKNTMSGFNRGYNGNTLFPIAYFDFPESAHKQPFALILDNRYPQSWDFSEAPYKLSVEGGDFKIHVLTGKTLADIRRSYMLMAGTPLLPPKSAFGLWVSEYGYENWAELDDKIATLKQNNFPVSGAVLDLQWFGGITEDANSQMGSLTWDLKNFPKPADKIAAYKKADIDMIVIEESYISKGLDEYKELDKRGFLAHDNKGNSLDVTEEGAWWGHGGMMDWSNKEGRNFWHDYRRQALVDAGVTGHWTDLGEPEMHNPDFKYGDGLDHEMIHNSFNMIWLQSIYDGYQRNNPEKRPFMMSRSGGIGMQALGAVIWSGDIGSDYASLAAQMPQQTHMMWSGLDYYGSDIGGFHRKALLNSDMEQTKEQAMDELYTQWFAYSSLYEVPVRAHTENLCNCKETTPDRIGDMDSNRASIKLRYELLPYYYSLAYRAYSQAEPLFPSLEYYYPNDQQAKNLGHIKMVGPFLVGSSVAEQGQKDSSTYLPKGTWYDFRSGKRVVSQGEWFKQELYINKILTLPLFAKEGALIPQSINKENSLKIFGFGEQQFTWYDDDGASSAYQQGKYQQIQLHSKNKQVLLSRTAGSKLTINTINWILPSDKKIKRVSSNLGDLKFEQRGTQLHIKLPDFDKQLNLELKL